MARESHINCWLQGLRITAHSSGINGQKIQVASAVQTATPRKQALNNRTDADLCP